MSRCSSRRCRRVSMPQRRTEPVALEQALCALAEERGVKTGGLIHATAPRADRLGCRPGLFEVMAILGRARVRERLSRAVAAIHAMRVGKRAPAGENQGGESGPCGLVMPKPCRPPKRRGRAATPNVHA